MLADGKEVSNSSHLQYFSKRHLDMEKYSCDSGIHAAIARAAERVNPAYLRFVSEAHSRRSEKVMGIYMQNQDHRE